MKIRTIVVAVLIAVLLPVSLYSGEEKEPGEIKLEITGLRNSEGQLLVAIWNREEDFLKDDRSVQKGIVKVKSGVNSYTFSKIPAGNYAIAVVHDENNNQKQDSSFFGYPTEGFGFSNNPRIQNGPASFEEARFRVDQNGATLSIRMVYL